MSACQDCTLQAETLETCLWRLLRGTTALPGAAGFTYQPAVGRGEPAACLHPRAAVILRFHIYPYDMMMPWSYDLTRCRACSPPALSLLGELHGTKPCTQAGLAGWGCTHNAAPTEPGGISPEMLKPLFYCRQTSLQEGEGCGTASTSLRARGTRSHCFTPKAQPGAEEEMALCHPRW